MSDIKRGWQSRIVGHGEQTPGDLRANPSNWRRHPKAQRDALAAVLDQVGWVQDIIVNQRTGLLVDGHARLELAVERGEASVPVVYVDLAPDEEALILATFDPLSAMAEADASALEALLTEVSVSDAALEDMLADLAAAGDAAAEEAATLSENYSRKIEAPIYEITGECPPVSALADETKTHALQDEINAADLPEDVRAFLLSAAERHTVFNFRNIAEFYAHANADVQNLMERSALVIIDFDRAIEEGFVKLAIGMMEQAEQSKSDNYA